MGVIVVILGLCWGSFLSVIKNRLYNLKSIFYTRSRCPKCKRKLGALDLVPVLSFVFSKGKCRYCKKRISLEYPFFEVLSATLALLVYLKYGLNIFTVILFLSLSCLMIAVLLDIQAMEVELAIFVVGISLALVWYFGNLGLNARNLYSLGWAVVLAAFLPLALCLLSRERWMGAGDIVFAFWSAAIVGYPLAAVAIFLSFISGAIFGIIIGVAKKQGLKIKVPFGPFVALGTVVTLFWGDRILSFYLKIIGL